MAKKKKQLAKLCAPIRSLLSLCSEFSFLLLSHSMPALVPAIVLPPILVLLLAHVSCLRSFAILLSCYLPAPVSHPGSPTILSSYCLPALVFCSGLLVILSSYHMPALVSRPESFAILSFYYALFFLLWNSSSFVVASCTWFASFF